MLKNKIIIPLTTMMMLSIFTLTSCNNNNNSSLSSSTEESLNYLALNRRITYAKDNYLTDEKKALYTKDSIDLLLEAVSEAENLINNATSQEQIDKAINKINDAIDKLVTNVKPDKTLNQIGEFMDNCKGNYTLKVTDYYGSDTPTTYTIKSTEKAIYDVTKNEGYVAFDGYVHDFNYVNDTFNLGRVHLGERQDPAVYLTSNRLDDVVSQVGVTEAFTSFGFPLYGGFKQMNGQKFYVTDSSTFFDLTLDLINNRYQSYDGFNGELNLMSMELSNDNVLSMRLYGKDLNDLKFDLVFTDFNKTTIDGVNEFLANNNEYQTKNNPMELVKTVIDNSKTNYSLKFNVFSHKEGRSNQKANYVITYKNNNDNEYWLSSSNKGIIKTGSEYKNFIYNDGNVEVTDTAKYGIKDIDIINKLLSHYNDFELLNKTDDYYLSISEDPIMQQMLYRFFELSNYQNVADKNYFGDEPSKINPADIKKISLTKNDEGKLVINLFSELSNNRNGLIIRAVLIDYQNVNVNGLEDLTSLSKNRLEELYNNVKNITNEKYTEKSYNVFNLMRNKAQEILNSQNSDVNVYNDMYTVLNNAYTELELKENNFAEDGENKIHQFLSNYSKYNVSYKMEVTSNGETLTYIAKYNNYFYCLENKAGYIMIDKFAHSFHVEDNNIIIDDICSNKYGAHFNQLSRVQPYFGSFENLAGIEDYETLSGSYMTRINNSNKYFTTNIDYLNFIPNVNLDVLNGFSCELLNNGLEINLYKSTSLNLSLEGANSYELASMNKGYVNAVVRITNLNDASNELLENFINSNEAIYSKEQMLNKLNKLATPYVIKNGEDNIALVSDKYYLDMKTNNFYALIKGKVNKYEYIPNFFAIGKNSPYELIEAGVKVNGKEATSIEQITGSLSGLKNLTSVDINLDLDEETNLNSKRYYYHVNDDKVSEMIKMLNIDQEDLGSLYVSVNSNGEIVIANFVSDYYIGGYYVLSNNYDETTDIMLTNIILMENGELDL